MTYFKTIVFIFLLAAFSTACTTAPRQEAGPESNLAVTRDWQDWRQPPPWSRR